MAWYIWLILAGIFLIFEIFTMGFLIFWLSIGALITMIISFFTSNILIQTSVFVITSSLLIFATKPLIQKFGLKDTVPTNYQSIIGKKGIVVEDINNIKGTGLVKINGETWSALSNNENIVIEKNSEVEIIQIKGVKVIVIPIK